MTDKEAFLKEISERVRKVIKEVADLKKTAEKEGYHRMARTYNWVCRMLDESIGNRVEAKRVNVDSEYGTWWYEKHIPNEYNNLPAVEYKFWNSYDWLYPYEAERYTASSYEQMIECIKQSNRKAREEFRKWF